MGDPRISEYYTAQITIEFTLTRAEADALALFLSGVRLRQPVLAQALDGINAALADRGITAATGEKKPPRFGG